LAEYTQKGETEHVFQVRFKDLPLTREQRDAIGREIDRGVARALTDMTDLTSDRRVDALRDVAPDLPEAEEEGPRGLQVSRT
jgi:hypothetical protein